MVQPVVAPRGQSATATAAGEPGAAERQVIAAGNQELKVLLAAADSSLVVRVGPAARLAASLAAGPLD